jgi:hypothetical protein
MKALLAALALVSIAPQAIVHALLTQPVRRSELPVGVTKVDVRKRQPGSTSKHHHVVGEVELDLAGANGGRIVYVVFPAHVEALGNYDDGLRVLKTLAGVEKVRKTLAGLPQPSILVDASVNAVGITQVTYVTGNVEIAAQSLKVKAPNGGEQTALALARFALRHLHAVEARVR